MSTRDDVTQDADATPTQLRGLWAWCIQHKEWVFSGIGTAILMAALGYFFSQGGGGRGVQAGRDVNIIDSDQGNSVIQTGTGTVTIEQKDTP